MLSMVRLGGRDHLVVSMIVPRPPKKPVYNKTVKTVKSGPTPRPKVKGAKLKGRKLTPIPTVKKGAKPRKRMH